jgi:hypothetical protein
LFASDNYPLQPSPDVQELHNTDKTFRKMFTGIRPFTLSNVYENLYPHDGALTFHLTRDDAMALFRVFKSIMNNDGFNTFSTLRLMTPLRCMLKTWVGFNIDLLDG